MKNITAIGAEQITRNITFRNEEHRKFFLSYLSECRYADVYHISLIYCLIINRDLDNVYDFKTGCIKI